MPADPRRVTKAGSAKSNDGASDPSNEPADDDPTEPKRFRPVMHQQPDRTTQQRNANWRRSITGLVLKSLKSDQSFICEGDEGFMPA